MPDIRIAETDAEIAACYPVMSQLRPHVPEADFIQRIRTQQREGFVLVALSQAGTVKAVAGYRYYHNLYGGHVLYVDDLVTDQNERSRGHGDRLFEWLVDQARERDCDSFELDSGVQRHGAHRFYLLHRMDITSYHFRLRLNSS